MRLRNILIVVKDIEKSKKFYHDLFGLDIILDNDETVILTGGTCFTGRKSLEGCYRKRSCPGE